MTAAGPWARMLAMAGARLRRLAGPPPWRALGGLLPLLALLVALGAAAPAHSRDDRPAASGVTGVVDADQLPRQARETLALIRAGGPFPYRKDGTEFRNREKHLPSRPRGYYREYTVKTPGSRDRGARRIIAGKGATGDVATSGEYWYTDDHYDSFRRIRE